MKRIVLFIFLFFILIISVHASKTYSQGEKFIYETSEVTIEGYVTGKTLNVYVIKGENYNLSCEAYITTKPSTYSFYANKYYFLLNNNSNQYITSLNNSASYDTYDLDLKCTPTTGDGGWENTASSKMSKFMRMLFDGPKALITFFSICVIVTVLRKLNIKKYKTMDDFKEVADILGYTIVSETIDDEFNTLVTQFASAKNSNDIKADFFITDDPKSCAQVYNKVLEKISLKYRTSESHIDRSTLDPWGKDYQYVSKKGNTVLFIRGPKEYSNELRKFIKKLKY